MNEEAEDYDMLDEGEKAQFHLAKLCQLSPEGKSQLPPDVRKALKALDRSKPTIPFSSATPDDCMRSDGLALNCENLGTYPSLRIPDHFHSPTPSDRLCEYLDILSAVWTTDNEKSRRIVIDALLTEVIWTEGNRKLTGYCEVNNDWEAEGVKYNGTADYMIGTKKGPKSSSPDNYLLIVEAKKDWPESAVAQILAEAGCLLKRRMAAGKKTPVFAVLSNGVFFRFFAIDTLGTVCSSSTLTLEAGPDRSYKSSTSLSEILRWLHWFISSYKSLSPQASHDRLTEASVKQAVDTITSCFITDLS
jgi:hypothetical protein